MNGTPCTRLLGVTLLALCAGLIGDGASVAQDVPPGICRPVLGPVPSIELGRAGRFGWSCQGGKSRGTGYYIVFIRPAGTYVLLKVPVGGESFEFTPDEPGPWRWLVINTDPDGTKPDLESEPGHFQVIKDQDSPR